MKRELRDKWLAALRSGKFQQARSVLAGRSGFCCLGVLCEVAGLEKRTRHPDGHVLYDYRMEAFDWDSDEPQTVWNDAELTYETAVALGLCSTEDTASEVLGELMSMNDVKRMSFAQIADWIEENVPVED